MRTIPKLCVSCLKIKNSGNLRYPYCGLRCDDYIEGRKVVTTARKMVKEPELSPWEQRIKNILE